MDDAISNALKRKAEIAAELREIDTFISLHRKFSGTKQENVDAAPQPANILERALGPTPQSMQAFEQAELDQVTSYLLKPRGRPADFVRIMETILKDERRPLSRGEFVDLIEHRGHSIPSDDKARYLGTILWRNSDVFENLEGRGYWLKGRPLPITGTHG